MNLKFAVDEDKSNNMKQYIFARKVINPLLPEGR
jgi:hypothetical protein